MAISINSVKSKDYDRIEDTLGIYDNSINLKWQTMPDYVKEARIKRLENEDNLAYDDILLSKWGRKHVESNKYIETPEMVFYRVSLSIAKGLVEKDPLLDYESIVRSTFDKFINREIFPNTPYMANAGHKYMADIVKRELEKVNNKDKKTLDNLLQDLESEYSQLPQSFACFVLDMYDSRDSIFDTLRNAAEIQALTGGTGFNFSNLRPANEAIRGTGGYTDGPISFMAAYSWMLGLTMNQGGKREGANMFMLDIDHPDIMRFIYSKRKDGEITSANISVAGTHKFFKAVRSKDDLDSYYLLKNPHYNPRLRPEVTRFYSGRQLEKSLETAEKMNKKAKVSIKLANDGLGVLSPFLPEGLEKDYELIGKVISDRDELKHIQPDLSDGQLEQLIEKGEGGIAFNAKKIMKHIAYGAWFNGEPGMIYLDHINDQNPTHPRHYLNYLKKKSPDKGLDELVGHINEVDKEGRLINLPIGIGLIKATNPCGEKPLLGNEACVLGHTNWDTFLDQVKGEVSTYKINWDKVDENTRLMYEILDNAIDQNHFTNSNIESVQKSNRKIGVGFLGLAYLLMKMEVAYDSDEGRELSKKIWKRQTDVSEDASRKKAEKFGTFPNFEMSMYADGPLRRNAIIRTLAPTGTTGFAAKTTGGCEPEYALAYTRKTVQGKEIDLLNPILDEKIMRYNIFYDQEKEKRELMNFIMDKSKGNGSMQGFLINRQQQESEESYRKRQENLSKVKSFMKTANDISPEDHIKMQAVIQEYTDDAISKTINFDKNATLEDVERAYLLADELKIKGTTFYRDGTRKDQPIEVRGLNKKQQSDSNEVGSESTLEKLIANKNRILPRKLPEIQPALRIRQKTPFGNMHVFIGVDPHSNEEVEVYAQVGKSGQIVGADLEGIGRLASTLLRSFGGIDTIIGQLEGIGSDAAMPSREGGIKSLPDGLATALKRYKEVRDKYGLKNLLLGEISDDNLNEIADKMRTLADDRNNLHLIGVRCPNPDCEKGELVMQEGCEHCTICGYTKC
nr:hypothetical protein [Candidatus Woesearchaeota archaeon]